MAKLKAPAMKSIDALFPTAFGTPRRKIEVEPEALVTTSRRLPGDVVPIPKFPFSNIAAKVGLDVVLIDCGVDSVIVPALLATLIWLVVPATVLYSRAEPAAFAPMIWLALPIVGKPVPPLAVARVPLTAAAELRFS